PYVDLGDAVGAVEEAAAAGVDRDQAEPVEDHRPVRAKGQPGLEAVELDVAPLEDPVVLRDGLEHEDRPQLGQGPRVLEEERVGHRGDEVVEAVVALEPAPAARRLAGLDAVKYPQGFVPEGVAARRGRADRNAAVEILFGPRGRGGR